MQVESVWHSHVQLKFSGTFTSYVFKYFISLCSDKEVSSPLLVNLINLGLCIVEDSKTSLTQKGRETQQKMGLQTQILQKIKVEGDAANNMVNDMLSQLGEI